MLKPTTLFLICSAALYMGACTGATEGPARGEALYNNCKTCHAADGHGNPAIKAPAIAGLPAWYIENQVKGYQKGTRGMHFDDIPGMRMRPMALSILNERAFLARQLEKLSAAEKETLAKDQAHGAANLKEVAAYIAAMAPVKNEATLTTAKAATGKAHYAACAACHGADGMGVKAMNAPPIAGAQDWYIADQLLNFRNGVRGYDPAIDANGATMAGMAKILPNDQAVLDVAAYIAALPRTAAK